jgi:hypothetical protein
MSWGSWASEIRVSGCSHTRCPLRSGESDWDPSSGGDSWVVKAIALRQGREEMYRHGGLFSVTSKILVNDFLSERELTVSVASGFGGRR